jgi:hypothetical protein
MTYESYNKKINNEALIKILDKLYSNKWSFILNNPTNTKKLEIVERITNNRKLGYVMIFRDYNNDYYVQLIGIIVFENPVL